MNLKYLQQSEQFSEIVSIEVFNCVLAFHPVSLGNGKPKLETNRRKPHSMVLWGVGMAPFNLGIFLIDFSIVDGQRHGRNDKSLNPF